MTIYGLYRNQQAIYLLSFMYPYNLYSLCRANISSFCDNSFDSVFMSANMNYNLAQTPDLCILGDFYTMWFAWLWYFPYAVSSIY